MTPPLLDTHAWYWWVDQDERLGAPTIAALDRLAPHARPLVSVISLWEVAMMVERHRVDPGVSLREWLEAATHPSLVDVVPITPAIAAATADLPADFRRDPVDRILVATSRVLNVPMLTYDKRITDAKLVARWRVRV